MSVLRDLATDILRYEFDNDVSVNSVPAISGWLEANLGQLNSLIYTSYSGDDAELDLEAQAIHKELYLYNYYSKQARNALRGIINSSSNGGDVLSLEDGESKVTFINRNEVSKVYRGLASDSMANIKQLVTQYNIYQAQPLQVGGIEGDLYSGIYY